MTEVADKVERAIAKFERVARHMDERRGPVQEAARRERRRLNAGLGRTLLKVGAALGVLWLVIILIGLARPIGMFGFLAALLLTILVAGVLVARGGRKVVSPTAPATDLPNGPMVDRFDSYLYRARELLPAAAQVELDGISKVLPSLKQTLERVETLDPVAQDARRLMSVHLPGLIERYERVPAAYRQESDGEGKTVDERLVEGLAAGRSALADVAEKLARADVAELETQGRFIQSRYGEQRIDS